MQTDFPQFFKSSYPNDEGIRLLKRRLYSKLRGVDIDCIVDGYELCLQKKPEYLPGVSMIVSSAIECKKQKDKVSKLKAEADRIGNAPDKPKSTMKGNPIQMLRDAINKPKPRMQNEEGTWRDETKDERNVRFKAMVIAHEKLVEASIKTRPLMNVTMECCVSFCLAPGVLSDSAKGENYYCREHYKKSYE